MCKISFFQPSLVSFSCDTVNIHLEKWLMRCDTKRAIWWDLYNEHISIFTWNIWVPSFARRRFTNDFSFCEINATEFGSKNQILHTIIYHYVTCHGYIIMIIDDSCMIWFHFDCIMQLKKSYYIATNVCSRKVLLLLVISLTACLVLIPYHFNRVMSLVCFYSTGCLTDTWSVSELILQDFGQIE